MICVFYLFCDNAISLYLNEVLKPPKSLSLQGGEADVSTMILEWIVTLKTQDGKARSMENPRREDGSNVANVNGVITNASRGGNAEEAEKNKYPSRCGTGDQSLMKARYPTQIHVRRTHIHIHAHAALLNRPCSTHCPEQRIMHMGPP